MRSILVILFCTLSVSISAQNDAARILEQIPLSEDKVQSVFYWVSNYLIYDTQFPASKKKYSEPKELIDYALQERSGICQHYAELFHYLISELGYESYVISGFSKETPGNSHAWNAVKIDGQWYLFDATFASGGITPSGKFIKEYDDKWYKVHPDDFIRTHMPFDYVWQFKSDPISYKCFESNTFDEIIITELDFERYTSQFVKLDDKVWCDAAIARINSQNYKNPLISNYLSYLNSVSYGLSINEKVDAHNVEVDKLNIAVEMFNNSVTDFNDYIGAKNRRFRVAGYSKDILPQKMNQIFTDVTEAMSIFSTIETHNDETMKVVRDNLRLGRGFLQNIRTEQDYIQRYVRRAR